MKKRILAPTMAAVVVGPLTACSGSSGTSTRAAPVETEAPASENELEVKEESRAGEGDAVNTASPKDESEGYELALVIDLETIDDKSFSRGIWEGLKKYVEKDSISHKYYQPQGGTTDPYLETIGLVIEDGAKLVVCPGFLFEESIYLIQDRYPNMYFILLDGEPHDVDHNYKTNDNVVPTLFQEDQTGLLAGCAVTKNGYTKLGLMGGVAVPTIIRFRYDFVQGAELAVEEGGIMDLGIMRNYTDAFSTTSETQLMAASRYQDGTGVVLGCGGAVGNSVVAAAQERNTKVIGMDVGQSTESETVITSAMKLPSNSVYDGVEDFYDSNFSGGKTSAFAVVDNGVGSPMDTFKFEKFSQEQYDAVYRKLADGEIGLAQFSVDNNDPTKDLTDLTDIKIISVEQGLAVVRAV